MRSIKGLLVVLSFTMYIYTGLEICYAGDNANASMTFDFYSSFPPIAGDNGHATLGGIGANQTVYLKIYAHNVKDLDLWEFRFRYDSNYVRLVQVKPDSDFIYQIKPEKNILNKTNSYSLWVVMGGGAEPNEVVVGGFYSEKADSSAAPDGDGLVCVLAVKTTSRFSLATETKFDFYRWKFKSIRDKEGESDVMTTNLTPGYLKGNTTALQDNETAATTIPRTFSLLQNYPNPFNPTTSIPFQLPMGANVTLSVYNTLGQEVAVLVNRYLPQGSYQIPFKMGTLPSGVYFYRLKAGSFVQTRQMLILK